MNDSRTQSTIDEIQTCLDFTLTCEYLRWFRVSNRMREIWAFFTCPNSTCRSPDYVFYCCEEKRIDKEHSNKYTEREESITRSRFWKYLQRVNVPFSISVVLSHRFRRIIQSWSRPEVHRPLRLERVLGKSLTHYGVLRRVTFTKRDWLKQNESWFWGHWRKARDHFSEIRIHKSYEGIAHSESQTKIFFNIFTELNITCDCWIWLTLKKFPISATRGRYFSSINKECAFSVEESKKMDKTIRTSSRNCWTTLIVSHLENARQSTSCSDSNCRIMSDSTNTSDDCK